MNFIRIYYQIPKKLPTSRPNFSAPSPTPLKKLTKSSVKKFSSVSAISLYKFSTSLTALLIFRT